MSSLKLVDSNFDGFPGGASGEEPACQCRRCKTHRFRPWVGKIPWRRGAQWATVCRVRRVDYDSDLTATVKEFSDI